MKLTRAWVMLTEKCNISCTYCFQQNKGCTETDKETLDKSIQFVIDRADDLELMLWGGEPLLRWDLITYAVEKYPSINFKFATNGTLLTKSMYEFMLSHKDNLSLCLSVDGIDQIKNRGVEATEWAYKAAAISNNFVHIVSVDTSTLYDSVKLIYDHGVRNFLLTPAHTVGYDNQKKEQYETEIRKILKWYREDFFKPNRFDRLNVLNWEDTLSLQFTYPENSSIRFCGAGYSAIAITPHGDIYPCDWFHDLKMHKLGDIYHGIDPEKTKLFEDINQNRNDYFKVCKGCPIETSCESHMCLTENIVVNGDMFQPVMTTCDMTLLEKKLIIEEGLREPRLIRDSWNWSKPPSQEIIGSFYGECNC